MKIPKKQKKESENLHKTVSSETAGILGVYKPIMLIGTALFAAALLAVIPLMQNERDGALSSDAAVLAKEKLRASDYSEAAELFKQAIETDPEDEELYIGLADSYKGMDESSMAREALETGYGETGSETIKAELERLEESGSEESEPESSEISSENSAEGSENPEKSGASLESSPEESKTSESGGQGGEANEASEPSDKKGTAEIKSLNNDNSKKHGDTEIFKSTAEWFELSSSESLEGIEKINSDVKTELEKYFELDPLLYGAESEEELYKLVKAQGKEAESSFSASVTYNEDNIISYTIKVVIQSPNDSYSSSFTELHTVDLKTGEELELSDIIGIDEETVKTAVKKAFSDMGTELSDSDCESLSFYLEGGKAVILAASETAYISLYEKELSVSESSEPSEHETKQE